MVIGGKALTSKAVSGKCNVANHHVTSGMTANGNAVKGNRRWQAVLARVKAGSDNVTGGKWQLQPASGNHHEQCSKLTGGKQHSNKREGSERQRTWWQVVTARGKKWQGCNQRAISGKPMKQVNR